MKKPKSFKEFLGREELPAEVGILRNMVRTEQQKRKKAEATHDIILGAAREILEPFRISGAVRPYKPKPSSQVPEAQLLHLSDLQIGKVTETYNTDVFKDRMETLFQTVLDILTLHRMARPVHDLFIALNGDLVEGEGIFPGQAWVTNMGVLQQALIGSQILGSEIVKIAPHYRSVKIVVTRGNHGRSGKDWCEASNWDLVLGELLKSQLRGIRNVEIEVCTDWYKVTEINGVKVMQTHGDRIRTGGDTPYTAIAKRISRWGNSIPGGFDVLVIGHFHCYSELEWNGVKFFLNGSPEDGNDYALSYMGLASSPMQTVFFLHPKKKVTARYPVYLS